MHCVERKVRLEELKGVASLWKEVNISSTLHGYAPKHFLLPQRHVTDSELVVTWKIPHGCVTLAHFLRDASTTNHTPTLAIGLAESVQVMHQAGIAHFALNSHNVLIDPQTLDVIIMGFHNALHWRCLGLAASADLRVHNIEAKLDEETLWPLQYISPEQWKRDREGPDYRADLYSLGVLLYEIASGSPPFGHLRSPQQLSLAHTELHPSPLFLQLEELKQEWATKAVAAMIHKLLEKEPSKRYCSAQSFLEDFALRERVVLPTDVDHKALTNPRERQEHLTLSIENRPRHSFGKKRSKSRLRKSSEDILTPSVSEACSVSPSVDGTADLVHELGKRGQRSFMRLPTCSVGGVNHVEKIIRAYQALTADRKSVAFFIEGGSGVGKSVLYVFPFHSPDR
jgi:serine/threonine protein kinase